MNRTKTRKTGSRILVALAAAAVLILSGCMSLNTAGESEISDILSLINGGHYQELAAISSSPFLLDGEILHGEALSLSFWKGLSASGFSLNNPETIRNEALTDSDASIFGTGKDVKYFFNKYIPEHSVIIEIDSAEGRTVLILSPADGGKRKMTAWGGPF